MKILLTASLLLISTLAISQPKSEVPKQEFKVSLSEPGLSIKPGETKSVTITITRSKSYSNLNSKLSVFNSLPAGISISFEPGEGNIESSEVGVSVSPEAAEGIYSLVLGATVNYKKKGSILTVTVSK
jgi:hypothetical protein